MQFSVKQARKVADLTQQEMANLLGIHVNTYREIEQHPEKATVEQAGVISSITGIAINDIFFCENSTFSRDCDS